MSGTAPGPRRTSLATATHQSSHTKRPTVSPTNRLTQQEPISPVCHTTRQTHRHRTTNPAQPSHQHHPTVALSRTVAHPTQITQKGPTTRVSQRESPPDLSHTPRAQHTRFTQNEPNLSSSNAIAQRTHLLVEGGELVRPPAARDEGRGNRPCRLMPRWRVHLLPPI